MLPGPELQAVRLCGLSLEPRQLAARRVERRQRPAVDFEGPLRQEAAAPQQRSGQALAGPRGDHGAAELGGRQVARQTCWRLTSKQNQTKTSKTKQKQGKTRKNK